MNRLFPLAPHRSHGVGSIHSKALQSGIVRAANPLGYRNWSQLVLPMIESTIAAAKDSGARILLPGATYNYGLDAFPILKEDPPLRRQTSARTGRRH
jgi:hypothetical protein